MIATIILQSAVCAALLGGTLDSQQPPQQAVRHASRLLMHTDPFFIGVAIEWQSLTDLVGALVWQCEEGQVPLSADQSRRLRESARRILKTSVREQADDFWLNVVWEYRDRPGPPSERLKKPIAWYRLRGAIGSGPAMTYPLSRLKQVITVFRRLASPEQLKAADYTINHPRFSRKTIDRLSEHYRRLASADTVRDELSKDWGSKIDESGPTEPRDLPPPSFRTFHANLLISRTRNFIELHHLSDEQKTSAQAICDDLTKRCGILEAAHQTEYERCWRQFVEAVSYPRQSKVSRRDAIRALRKSLDAAAKPFRGDLERRLNALLTSEQRAAAKAWQPPKPEWLEIIEEVREEEKASAKPVPSSRPAKKDG